MTSTPARPATEAIPSWVRDAVFYQVFPDRFARSARVAKAGPLESWDTPPTTYGFKGGDLLGIAERLDELADLGISALYLTPVFTSAANHRYHTYDYLSVDPLLGGDAALRELVDGLHARGMRIVLDGVFNHTGRGFWPFHHVVENGLASPYADWFHLDRERLVAGPGIQPYPHAPFGVTAGEAEEPQRDGRRSMHALGYRAWWDLPALPKLNTDHPAVREYLWSVAEHWLRFGIDGWRLDVPGEIDDPGFWAEFRRRCRAVNPDAYLVGEIWDVAPDWADGRRFDGLMNYPLLEAILSFVGGPSLDMELTRSHHELRRHVDPTDAAGFAARLHHLLGAYRPDGVAAQLNLLSSHDMPRFRSLVGGDATAFLLATMLQMSLPGAPCIYYGDEVGLEGRNDPDCRRAFPSGSEGRDEATRRAVKALVAARNAHPALRSDGIRVLAARDGALIMERGGSGDASARGESLLLVVNSGVTPVRLDLDASWGGTAAHETIVSVGGTPTPSTPEPGEPRALLVAPRSGAILGRGVSSSTGA